MSWQSILKFRFQRTFDLDELKAEDPEFYEEHKNKFLTYIGTKTKGRKGYGVWILTSSDDSRQEAFDGRQREFIRDANPDPWTMEGNLYQGIASVYDGPAMVLGAPQYYYYIAEGFEDSPPENPEQEIRVDMHNPDRVLDRMQGFSFDKDRDDFPEKTKEENR